jgi:8-oxo-dGTP pyrophosphatase MutT (NUDIX family)
VRSPAAGSLALVAHGEERTRWKVLDERVVDENPRLRLSVATVELPDGTVFDQYVMRTPRGAMTVVLDDDSERVLLIWRHRFVTGQWLWELPGGFIDPGEDGAAAAAREVEEETGYRPRSIEPILTFNPIAGTADTAYELYLARGADHVGTPDPNETEAIRWIPLTELPGLITKGEISGAATIIGVQHALLTAGPGHR